jgi:hypothetical protein
MLSVRNVLAIFVSLVQCWFINPRVLSTKEGSCAQSEGAMSSDSVDDLATVCCFLNLKNRIELLMTTTYSVVPFPVTFCAEDSDAVFLLDPPRSESLFISTENEPFCPSPQLLPLYSSSKNFVYFRHVVTLLSAIMSVARFCHKFRLYIHNVANVR